MKNIYNVSSLLTSRTLTIYISLMGSSYFNTPLYIYHYDYTLHKVTLELSNILIETSTTLTESSIGVVLYLMIRNRTRKDKVMVENKGQS